MLRSRLMGLVRIFIVFSRFNKAVIRWPRIFIEQSRNNIAKYGEDTTFKERVDSMSNWIPLKVRIVFRTTVIAWHIANIDFSCGLEGMYRFSIMQKVVNDLVVSLLNNGMLSGDLIDEFIEYEEAIKSGNMSGAGRVWDFHDTAYNTLVFTKPYLSVLDSLLKHDFIARGVYVKYSSDAERLDAILRKHDAVMYSGSNSDALLKGYDDSYFVSRLFKDDSISLTRLMELPVHK